MSKHTLKPAAEKLSLAVRKNIRDEWDVKRTEFEKQLSDLLGASWKITADTKLIYANVTDESYASRLGQVIVWYIEPLIQNMNKFVQNFGDDGKTELNSTVSSHTIDFGPQDSTDFSYGGLVVENDVLRLVYQAPDSFASNVDGVSSDISGALQAASLASGSGSAYDIIARNGVHKNYDPNIETVRKEIEDLTGLKGITLNANFEQNAEALSKNKETRDDWNSILGKASLSYFEGLAYQLKRAGFKDDDMLQEGIQEAVTKGEISLQVVDKLASGNYNCVILEDGSLVMQTTPANWWSNVDDVGSNILDIL